MSTKKAIAVIAGVGPGTGSSIARKFAQHYPVIVLARNPSNYAEVVQTINSSGGQAIGLSTDLSDSTSVSSTFKKITTELFPDSPIAAAVFNSGGGFVRKPFLELTESEFAAGWEGQVKGAFLFAQATLPLLLKGVEEKVEFPPSLIFTGATASIRGSANFSVFASAKFGLRALSQSLAREFGPKGVHVSHVIVDGVIDIPRTKEWKFEHEDAKISPDAIADSYWFLHTQPRTTFAYELDLRPYVEKW
ncbi:oxidoreductase, short chain dehydrogenase/reductase family [Talaromyces stipitatus ATCC 10500]|uniref:Oxidoreductase, short chain dehydrogenase/reductase family n=1 Tax=Talaromyces stipitatus (strain ATCC 10500 / CBS 375.48 / QM 6759 / NRRL 1006) TaxID=441959 RepID=B8MQ57_TALSN|nr:oxidoreductase, short chain dehydrogenase/reductase family [Talaromyces stipitatus ATCC 10500]EED13083.1 oxidoreductase, short chain dehydrogenase/reductase family [Talaromyces stipitatus ATCC 10500]